MVGRKQCLNSDLICLKYPSSVSHLNTGQESGYLETLLIQFCTSHGLGFFKFNHNSGFSGCALLILGALPIISFYHEAAGMF